MNNWFLEYLEMLRSYEITLISPLMPPNQTILELGGGTGWQARQLANMGHKIISIDLPSSDYRAHQLWDVIPYDGTSIPLASSSVDVVFSSNVLEHIPHVVSFQSEIHRVLKPAGIVIHVLPTGTWRFWSTCAYFVHYVERAYLNVGRYYREWIRLLFSRPKALIRPTLSFTRHAILVPRHGEFGNLLTEIYYFSRWRWHKLFKEAGWRRESTTPNHLYYTGYYVFGKRLSISNRRFLSYFLGSACNIYVLKKPAQGD